MVAGAAFVACAPVKDPSPSVPSDDPVGEQNDAVQGTNLSGTNLAGTNLAGTNLAGTNLAGANLGGANLAGTNLAGTNLAGTNMGGNNLAGTNLAGTNLAGTNLAGTNLAGTNLAGTNLAGTNLAGTNLAGTNVSGNNLAGTNLAGTNLAGTNSGYNIHGLGGSLSMLYSGEDVWLPKTGQCIVMGIGSTAFPKLLGQQTANAKISAAVGKLPWGFANSSGGPKALDAWEAVIWGDRTYCTFVLAAPPGTAWAGVAGFIKAIFQWNAPTSQPMDISGIEKSASIDPTLNVAVTSYNGMMNAASKWNNGNGSLTATAFVAGELAFISAMTNNQTVAVDFATWIQDKNKNGMILANVTTSPLPTYAESVYIAVDNGDGTVGIQIDDAAFWASVMPAGMTDSTRDLESKYDNWRYGGGPKPVPRRCGASLDLHQAPYGEDVEIGKCDNGLYWSGNLCLTGSQPWSAYPGTTAPMNQYMQITLPGGQYARAKDGTCNLKQVLSETYVHMWTPSYDLNLAYGGAASASATNSCSPGEDPAKAFDNLMTPNNHSKWCVGYGPTSSSPVSLMYTFSGTNAHKITSYSITSANDVQTRDPRDWTLQGCNGTCAVSSDSGWVTLDSRKGQWFPERYQSKRFAFTNTTAYRQIRLRITANYGDSVTQLEELRLFDTGACAAQSDASLCASYGKNCGSLTANDNCGATRTVANCGACTSPQTCAGGGVANVCGTGAYAACKSAYAQSKCMTYVEGQTQVSNNGHNYLCANGNCRNCATTPSCAPGQSGCPWGAAWQDNGPCGSGSSSPGCNGAYAQANCYGYTQGAKVSRNGHNYTCTNSNCAQCSAYASCSPGSTGCPWGSVWRDDGACY
jgi:hypothetical protein